MFVIGQTPRERKLKFLLLFGAENDMSTTFLQ